MSEVGAVPRIVHQTAPADQSRWDPRWEQCRLSWQSACKAPEFTHKLWDDVALRSLFAEAFPEHLDVFDGYEVQIQRVDIARAAMLHLHGGLYVDMDVEALSSPFAHFRAGMVVIVESPYPENERHQNSMMASPARHPFWRAFVEEAVRRRGRPHEFRTTWQLTGPQLLDAVAAERPQEVQVLPAWTFNPPLSSPCFHAVDVITRHLCTAVWTHNMDKETMRLSFAARSGNYSAAADALREGADLHGQDYAGLTPLHHAAMRGHANVISCLLHMQANADVCDSNDTTPLCYGVQAFSPDVVRTLLAHRARTDIALKAGPAAGCTALDLARCLAAQQKLGDMLSDGATVSLCSKRLKRMCASVVVLVGKGH